MVQSVVSTKGQTVVPREIREALGLKPQSRLMWTLKDGTVVIRALPDNPIDAAMGALKGRGISTAKLLEERRKDREKEEVRAD
jgi:AbrB family looped-hinge helix DNA binding protein